MDTPEPAYQVEQQLAARLGERQIAEFVEHHQINAGELLGQPAGDTGAGLGLQTVDQVDDVEEARPRAALAYAKRRDSSSTLLPGPPPRS